MPSYNGLISPMYSANRPVMEIISITRENSIPVHKKELAAAEQQAQKRPAAVKRQVSCQHYSVIHFSSRIDRILSISDMGTPITSTR